MQVSHQSHCCIPGVSIFAAMVLHSEPDAPTMHQLFVLLSRLHSQAAILAGSTQRPCTQYCNEHCSRLGLERVLRVDSCARACRFVQITLGLFHIHSKNILHRDLKSQNIFIAEGEEQRWAACRGC